MDLVLSEQPSTEDRIVQLEIAELEVRTLVDILGKKMFPILIFPLVSNLFGFFGFLYILA
jgi:hypothetical protein